MNSFSSLSLGFLVSKPQAAASVLQGLNTAQAAGYLEEIPVRTLAPVLQNMETWPAARILDCLPLEKNVAILSQLSYQMLRHCCDCKPTHVAQHCCRPCLANWRGH